MEIEKETNLLQVFQSRVIDLNQDDETCLRFLRAREFNLEKAEEMIRNSEKWRREVLDIGIDSICNMIPTKEMITDFPSQFTGLSRKGGPVLWQYLGRWKFREWIDSGRKKELQMYDLHVAEQSAVKCKALGNKRVTMVYDVEHLSFRTVSHMGVLGFVYSATQTAEQNYPEILDSLIVINAPWIVTMVYNFVKPALSAHTLNKIRIFGSDKNEWLPVVRELCQEDAIPKEYIEN